MMLCLSLDGVAGLNIDVFNMMMADINKMIALGGRDHVMCELRQSLGRIHKDNWLQGARVFSRSTGSAAGEAHDRKRRYMWPQPM
jgi:hypothetical protein